MAAPEPKDTHQKALSINLDRATYGTLAEIGAGQEVARWLLQVGGASGTVAKTISAYDMTFSDEIYGKVGRYVSRERLAGMLEKEYGLLIERLGPTRESDTRFFVFADTISARNFAGTNECHGWIGMRFQAAPGGAANDVMLHVNLLDSSNLLQQEAVGILGINLIYGASYLFGDLRTFLASLVDHLSAGRIEIDAIALSGPEFAAIDNRAAQLELVHGGLAEAVLFPVDGPPRPPSEVLRKRPLVFEPGVFEAALPIHGRMLEVARSELLGEIAKVEREPLSLFALTTRRPTEPDPAPVADLLSRVDHLLGLGDGVLVVARPEAYRLVEYATRYTHEPIRLALGIATLAHILQERQYEHLDGRLLEALAKLFAFNVRLLVYPMPAADFARATDGTLASGWMPPGAQGSIGAQDLVLPRPLSSLYEYLLETGFLRPIAS